METTLVAFAAFAAVSSYAGVTIDGLFDAGYQSNSLQGVRVSGIEGNGAGTSQFNLRGTEDLGGGLSSSFHLETDFSSVSNAANTGSMFSPNTASVGSNQNNGAAGRFGNGEIAVGVKGGFGQVQFGAINNAGLEFVAQVAPVFGTALGGGYGATIGANTGFNAVRWANSVRYDTPIISGFQASYIYAAKQNYTTTTNYNAGMGYNNVAGAQELSARYTAGPLKLLFVNSMTLGTGGTNDTQRDFGVSYNISDAWAVQAGAQNTQLNSTGVTTNGRVVGTVYTMGQNRLLANVNTLSNATNTANQVGLGYDYLLSKTTKVYFRSDRLTDANSVSFATSAGLIGNSGGKSFTKNAVGVRVDF